MLDVAAELFRLRPECIWSARILFQHFLQGSNTVIIPESPGTMCARGVLLSDVTRDFVSTQIKRAEGEPWIEIR